VYVSNQKEQKDTKFSGLGDSLERRTIYHICLTHNQRYDSILYCIAYCISLRVRVSALISDG
jgi:hypothetical protein